MRWKVLQKTSGQVVVIPDQGKMANGRPWASEKLLVEVFGESEAEARAAAAVEIQEAEQAALARMNTPGGGTAPR